MAEANIFAEFYKQEVLMGFKSHEAGKQIYEPFDYIRIRTPGLDKQVVEREATEADKVRFAAEWDAYKNGTSQINIGTRIENWPTLTEPQVRTLQNLNIFTIEAMADLSDAGCQKVGIGAYKLREDAKKYLANDVGTESAELKVLTETQAKVIEDQGKQLAVLQQQMAALLEAKSADKATVKLPVKPALVAGGKAN